MNITYKEYKEKLKIELNEYKEKLKLKLDEFKAKQKKKLENFKLKKPQRKIKGGDLTDAEIDIIVNKYITLLNKINELKIPPENLEDKLTIEIIRSELINISSSLLLKLDKKNLLVISDKFKSFYLEKNNNDHKDIILIIKIYSLFNEILLKIKQEKEKEQEIEQEFYDYNMQRTTKEEFGGGKRKSKFFHK